jgi:endogenous inhibitor of DNA gyrase (YacG/DUF329 family)
MREPGPAPRGQAVRCPTCASVTSWAENPHRPFCSSRCRLIDLGRWLDERYRVEGDERLDDDAAPEPPRASDVGSPGR